MSSHYEGWGRTIVEAMAARVPIVTTDVGCVGSFFRPPIDGRVVQPEDVTGLASAIREQMTERERRDWMVQNAYERAQTFPQNGELITQQRETWSKIARQPTTDNRRSWRWTAALIIFSLLVHGASVALF